MAVCFCASSRASSVLAYSMYAFARCVAGGWSARAPRTLAHSDAHTSFAVYVRRSFYGVHNNGDAAEMLGEIC